MDWQLVGQATLIVKRHLSSEFMQYMHGATLEGQEACDEFRCEGDIELAARYFAVDAFYDVSGDTRARDYVFESGCTLLGIDSSSAPSKKQILSEGEIESTHSYAGLLTILIKFRVLHKFCIITCIMNLVVCNTLDYGLHVRSATMFCSGF